MPFTLYHNPDCGTSRNTLALLQSAGVELEIIEYLRTPPSRTELSALIRRMGFGVRDLLRRKGTPYLALGLDNPALGDDALLDAMLAHPILINRPIVVSHAGVKLCRPSDVVIDLLPTATIPTLLKEEGVPFLVDEPVPGDDEELIAALAAETLPVGDLAEPDRRLFRYRTPGGGIVGFGGFEALGEDALLRSIVVLPEARAKAIGRNLLALLARRAFDAGARRAWVLTDAAAPFFERAGFKPIGRDKAPSSILATRQASGLCPSTATLLSRRIEL